jgi:outer membrane protein OmpA-like peptidoglycan-associated protein
MANSIFDSVKGMVTPEMRDALAARMSESPQTVQAGLNSGIAAILVALAGRAGDSSFLSRFVDIVRGATQQNILGSVPSLVSQGLNGGAGELVNRFLSLVFGGDQAKAAAIVAQKSGVGQTTANSLLSMAAPIVLGYFSKLQSAGTLNPATLGSTLRAEAANLEPWVPASYATQTPAATVGAVTNLRTTELGDGPGIGNGAAWILSLALIGAVYMPWMVYRSVNTRNNMSIQPVTAVAAAAAVSQSNIVSESMNAAANIVGVLLKTKLPDGTELSVPKEGVESNLVAFLNDTSKPVDKTTWFDFDRLQFGTNDATLQPSSNEQLQNIAEILKAYPKVKIRIGGYTDNTGDKAANMKLSDERAKSVMSELEKLGVDKSRMSAKGYGDQHAIAPNETEEGRQKNRRISLLVTEK